MCDASSTEASSEGIELGVEARENGLPSRKPSSVDRCCGSTARREYRFGSATPSERPFATPLGDSFAASSGSARGVWRKKQLLHEKSSLSSPAASDDLTLPHHEDRVHGGVPEVVHLCVVIGDRE